MTRRELEQLADIVAEKLKEKMMPLEEAIDLDAAAEFLGCSKDMIRRRQDIPRGHGLNGKLRFRKSELAVWKMRNGIY